MVRQREEEWRRQREEMWRRRREDEWRRGREKYDTVLVSPSLNDNISYNGKYLVLSFKISPTVHTVIHIFAGNGVFYISVVDADYCRM